MIRPSTQSHCTRPDIRPLDNFLAFDSLTSGAVALLTAVSAVEVAVRRGS